MHKKSQLYVKTEPGVFNLSTLMKCLTVSSWLFGFSMIHQLVQSCFADQVSTLLQLNVSYLFIMVEIVDFALYISICPCTENCRYPLGCIHAF